MQPVVVARQRWTPRVIVGLFIMPAGLVLFLVADFDWPGGAVGLGIGIAASALGTAFSLALMINWLLHRGVLLVGGPGWLRRVDPWFVAPFVKAGRELEGDLSDARLVWSEEIVAKSVSPVAMKVIEVRSASGSIRVQAGGFNDDVESRFATWLEQQTSAGGLDGQ